jgi:hypothetical protein
VATSYFNLRALDRQLEIARDTLASRSNALELTRIKFDDGQGIVSELDVAQAQTQVAATQSSIASLQRQIALAENALSLLLGGNPGAIPRGQALAEQWQPGDLPAGLPSDLLLRRPDVRAAEQQLSRPTPTSAPRGPRISRPSRSPARSACRATTWATCSTPGSRRPGASRPPSPRPSSRPAASAPACAWPRPSAPPRWPI